jgi:SAM-dependent methyltransferase
MTLERQPEQTFAPAIENAVNYTRWVLAQFGGAIGSNIVEVGIGHGGYSRYMPPGADYCGVDIDPVNIEGARQRHRGSKFVQLDITTDAFVQQFEQVAPDTILCCNVIEHIRDDRLAVGNMLRVLAPKGKLLLFVPALPVLFNDLDRLAGHYRRYTKRSLRAAVPDIGRIESLVYFNSVGAVGWFANKLVRHQEIDSARVAAQVAFFDRVLVPVSRIADRLTGRTFGQSLVAIVGKS